MVYYIYSMYYIYIYVYGGVPVVVVGFVDFAGMTPPMLTLTRLIHVRLDVVLLHSVLHGLPWHLRGNVCSARL